MKSYMPRFIYNDDSCTLRTAPPPHALDSITDAIDYLKGTQVDCFCWLVGEQIAYSWPSRVIENFYDLQAKGASLTPGWDGSRDVMYSLHRQGIDYLPRLIERAHEQTLMFVASFRMNDTHIKSYPTSAMSSDYWKTHQHLRIWDATDAKGYYNAALDYSFPEVRHRYQAAIEEVATNYDVDGVELDFTRSPYFFNPSEAWAKRTILTRFVKGIGHMLNKIGRQRKRPLMLILRVASPKCTLVTAGIDLKVWIRRRLAPILVISELTNNYNMDITPWRQLCRKHGVLLYPAVECIPAYNRADFYSTQVRNPQGPRHDGSFPATAEEKLRLHRAAAQNLLAQHPDGLYLFNYPCRLVEGEDIMHADPVAFRRTISILKEVGSLKTLAKTDKRYTYFPELPIYVEANRPRRYHQTIPFTVRGKDIIGSQVTISFRQIAEKNPHADGEYKQNPIVKPGLLRYYLNDQEIPERKFKKRRMPAGRIPSGFLLKRHERIELKVSGKALRDGTNTLAFEMPKFPHERDPYVYIYELAVDVTFGG